MDGPGTEYGRRIRIEQQMQGRREGCRYPEALRREASEWAATRLAGGQHPRTVGAVLGVHEDTVVAWVKRYGLAGLASGRGAGEGGARAGEERPLVPIRVTVRPDPGRPSEVTATDVTLVTPGGYRLQGLSRAEALALFQSLP